MFRVSLFKNRVISIVTAMLWSFLALAKILSLSTEIFRNPILNRTIKVTLGWRSWLCHIPRVTCLTNSKTTGCNMFSSSRKRTGSRTMMMMKGGDSQFINVDMKMIRDSFAIIVASNKWSRGMLIRST